MTDDYAPIAAHWLNGMWYLQPDHDKGKVSIQKRGEEEVYLSPDEARDLALGYQKEYPGSKVALGFADDLVEFAGMVEGSGDD